MYIFLKIQHSGFLSHREQDNWLNYFYFSILFAFFLFVFLFLLRHLLCICWFWSDVCNVLCRMRHLFSSLPYWSVLWFYGNFGVENTGFSLCILLLSTNSSPARESNLLFLSPQQGIRASSLLLRHSALRHMVNFLLGPNRQSNQVQLCRAVLCPSPHFLWCLNYE